MLSVTTPKATRSSSSPTWTRAASLTTGDTQITEYAWDHRNRLVCVTDYATFADYHVTASQVVQYGYDFLNRMVVRTVDGESEYFVYDGDTLATDWVSREFGRQRRRRQARSARTPASILARSSCSSTKTAARPTVTCGARPSIRSSPTKRSTTAVWTTFCGS